ncbi:MAG: phospho-N-acetylmuramoyl-pentapeptide-transferase [Proteobacteria bacterium]|nr:phospho-N-acetylmuramoyl-pentapeptide-transferase [Pseudomonadota bacterium]
MSQLQQEFIIYLLLPFLVALGLGCPVIKTLKHLKSIQAFRELGPQSHIAQKLGTPTMGSWIFVIPFLIAAVYYYFTHNVCPNIPLGKCVSAEEFLVGEKKQILIAILSFVAGFILGLADDALKIFQSNYKGLSSKQKLLLQFVISTAVLFFSGKAFTILAVIWAFIIIAGASNAFNLTDGLDGLASLQMIAGVVAFQAFMLMRGDWTFFPLSLALVAVLIGFLVFNLKPAKVFMGDSGSLALGTIIGVMAYLKDLEWFLLVFTLIPVLEAVSVVLQVSYFKITKKLYGEGKRLFRMSPLHHHFELSGFTENQVVWGFFVVQIIVSLTFFVGLMQL